MTDDILEWYRALPEDLKRRVGDEEAAMIFREELREALYNAASADRVHDMTFADPKRRGRIPRDGEVETLARRIVAFLDGLPDPLDVTEVAAALREEFDVR